jgi:C-terminal processing protease CtpA/Prc
VNSVNDNTPDSTLTRIIDSLIEPLHDRHATFYGAPVSTPSSTDSFKTFSLSTVSSWYLKGNARSSPSGNLAYGRIHDSIGYIYIYTFLDDPSGWGAEIVDVMDSLRNTKCMILDVRGNDGGSAAVERSIAAHFAHGVVGHWQTRSGPQHEDFSAPSTVSFSKAEPFYDKPIYLLTDRYSMSAAEWFTMALRTSPNVVQVGDTTSGCFSGRLDRELSNGWIYSLSFMRVTDRDGVCYEGRGLAPDVLVRVSWRSAPRSHDTVLERVFELIR